MMVDRLHARPLVLQLPLGREDQFRGVIDLVRMVAYVYEDDMGVEWQEIPIPEDMRDRAEAERTHMIETLAERDDHLMMDYLEGEEISEERLKAAIRQATLDIDLTPVLCGSSFKNKGVQMLLDAVVDYLPSPLDVPPVEGINPHNGQTVIRHADDDEPFSAIAFKIMSDPFVGKLTYFRVYSGHAQGGLVRVQLQQGQEGAGRPHPADARQPPRRHHPRSSPATSRRPWASRPPPPATPCATTAAPIVLESIEFPEPVIFVAIEPKTKADQDRLAESLMKLADEDPTFRVRTDEETGQTIIAGMGELHLEIIVDRLLREFKVDANVGRPQVAYREGITKAVPKAEGRFVRQTGGRGQYGHVVIKMEPNDYGAGFTFENKIVGGAIPKEYIPAVESGLVEAMETGVLAGFPMEDVKVELIDGSYHEVDSSEMAFKIAGSMAFREAAKKAHPVLLEPIEDVEVVVPEEYMGDVMGDLNSRRGHIEGMEPRAGAQVIRARVPLATDVRVCHRPPLHDPGPGHVHHAVQSLR